MKHLKTIISVLVLLVAVSCAKTPSAGSGQVNFGIASNQEIADMTKSNVSDYTALPSAEDFTLSISGPEEYRWNGKISEWLPETILLAGEYSVTATYGSIEEEGFDKPYFTGSTTFQVNGGETTEVSVPVRLGNTVVKIVCTENFQKYYKDYSFKASRTGIEIATFAKDENKAAFVDGYLLTLSGTLVSETKTYEFSKSYSNLDPATAYTFTFDVSNVGGSSINITFKDGYTETVELGVYELNE